jgi:3-hydroxy-9,10-secoandrosta-1,3,5(10)-triene-9,17-dione monooxygenase
MTTEASLSPDGTLINDARSLVPLLRKEAAEADRTGQLSPAVAKSLRDAGFLTLMAPGRFGAPEASVRTTLEVARELARGCGSSAWVSLLLSGHAYLVALMDEEAQLEVWGTDRHTAVCLSYAPTGTAEEVPGGIKITGRWQPMSGIHLADWALVGVMLPEGPEQGSRPMLALVPRSDLTLLATWDNVGMRATAGDTVSADAVFVPRHRLLSFSEALAGHYDNRFPVKSLYRSPLGALLPVILMGPVLGLAEAAFTATAEILRAGKPLGGSTYQDATDSPSVQLALADTASLVDTASLHTYRALEDIERAHAQGSPLDMPARARIRMDVGVAVSRAREAGTKLLTLGGARGLNLANPVQRMWRDLETAARHPVLSPDLGREVYGRALLGKPGQVTPII